jgi:hypothetical protein
MYPNLPATSNRQFQMNTMNPINHAMIAKAYGLLSGVFYSESTNYAEQLFDCCKEEEKRHRGFADGWQRCHPNGCTVAEAARLFSVKRVAEYLTGERMPRGKDYLHTQRSCFIAAGIAHEYRKQIRAAWKGLPVELLAGMDYIKAVSPERAA